MKLAIKGGTPIIPQKYESFVHPQINEKLKNSVVKQLHRDISIYDNGGIYKEFEGDFRKLFNFNGHVLTTNSGTTALYSMFFGLDIKPGDEVIVPSYTFFATATPLVHFGAIIKFADCLDNGNIDPIKVEELITEKTKAVVVTHMWGIPCDMEELIRITKKHNILLLEDSSHAHGAIYQGKYIGTFADGSAWSFQGKKVLTCGEGGVFATKHTRMFERAVLAGHFNKRAKKEVFSEDLAKFNITGLGLNLRMHPLGAAIGLEQIQNFDEMIAHRRETACFLAQEISKIEGLSLPRVPDNSSPAWYAFPIIYNQKVLKASITSFVEAVNLEGAKEVDIPGSTCPLDKYKIFSTPEDIFYIYGEKHRTNLDSKYFINAHKYHASMFKLPTWYGSERMKYAELYISAIKKVIENINEII